VFNVSTYTVSVIWETVSISQVKRPNQQYQSTGGTQKYTHKNRKSTI